MSEAPIRGILRLGGFQEGPPNGFLWITEVELGNFLSFGPDPGKISLRPLNVLVGPNGSGKSNFLEAFAVLRAAPTDIKAPFRNGGGVADWLYKGGGAKSANVNATMAWQGQLPVPSRLFPLEYRLQFAEESQRLAIQAEELVRLRTENGLFYRDLIVDVSSRGALVETKERGIVQAIDAVPNESIFSQLRDPLGYFEITLVALFLRSIRMYRSWSFGSSSLLRSAQKPDAPNDLLAEDYSNLFLVLNQMESNAQVEQRLLEFIRVLLPEVRRMRFNVDSGSILLYLVENDFQIPATRLSDGTLRWLCLLAILLHPSPPPLVVIEEPELGLHPDLLPTLADLLLEASGRMQLVVTTHSDILIDALSETPESILVAEKHKGQTTITRLNAEELQPWLEKYRLGALWIEGHIGGKRW